MENPNNRIVAAGRLESEPKLSHEVMNEPFFTGTLLVKRLSGAVDRLPVTIPGKLLACMPPNAGQLLMMSGQVRSYNKVVDGAGRLMVTLFAQNIAEAQENDTLNKVTLIGALFLAVIALLPTICAGFTGMNISLGGTSVIIVVGVALETVRAIESQMLMRHYKGFLE